MWCVLSGQCPPSGPLVFVQGSWQFLSPLSKACLVPPKGVTAKEYTEAWAISFLEGEVFNHFLKMFLGLERREVLRCEEHWLLLQRTLKLGSQWDMVAPYQM